MDANGTLYDGVPDTPQSESTFLTAIVLFLLPFAVIPVSIVLVRLVKYYHRRYQARKYGLADSLLFDDPLAELGLNLSRGYHNTAAIRKVRKEHRRMSDEIARKRLADSELNAARDKNEPQSFLLKPIHVADRIVGHVASKTKQNWTERYSPEAVRRWVNVSRYSRAWMMFQVLVTILAIINYVMLTYMVNKDQADQKRTVKDLDLLYSSFFLMDYVLNLYIAEDALQFYYSPMSLVDLVSIITPFMYVFVSTPSQWVWFVGMIRISRATRVLRTYRLLSFQQTDETREFITFCLNFLNFIFFSASLINATESLVVAGGNPPSLKNWHDSLYYIMVTFSTIGFGDLTPSSTISRVIVMALIVMVVIYIPYQTSQILELYKSFSKYQRAKYTATTERPHIILAGQITYTAIVDFSREYFLVETEGFVIIVGEEEPAAEIRKFLNHPLYRTRLVYLRGDVSLLPDMKRASASNCTGLFLLNSPSVTNGSFDEEEEIRITRGQDAKILMHALVVKNTYPGLPIFAQVNDTRSKDLAAHCGCDRVICIEELQASLYASNCIHDGLLALIPNLLHTYPEQGETSSSEWMREYQHGISNQILSFKIPNGLVGLKFEDAVREVYSLFSTMIIGLVSRNSGNFQNPMRMSIHKYYRIKPDDIAICISDSEETILRISIHFKTITARLADLSRIDLENSFDKVLNRQEFLTQVLQNSPNMRSNQSTRKPEKLAAVFHPIPTDLHSHIIICGNLNTRNIRHFVRALRAKQKYSDAAFPVVCILEKMPADTNMGAWTDILEYGDVYVVPGSAMKKTTLERCNISLCQKIVLFADQRDTKDATTVFMVKMIQNEWPNCNYLVELIDGTNVKYFSENTVSWNTDRLRMQSIMNNYSLSISDRQAMYRKVRTEGLEHTNFFTEIVSFVNGTESVKDKNKPVAVKSRAQKNEQNKANNNGYSAASDTLVKSDGLGSIKSLDLPETGTYMQRIIEEAELNDLGISTYVTYHFDHHFSAGRVATSFVNALLCQSFFRPYILETVKLLVDLTIQIPVNNEWVGKPYREIVNICLGDGYVPLGLYRAISRESDDQKLPFVSTNCRQGDLIGQGDYVFVIRKSEDRY